MNIDWLALTPQSGGAGINQPVGFQLIKVNDSFENKTIKVRAVCGGESAIKTITLHGKRYPAGTVFNFDYTGAVQEVTLPPGRYKLQCWGAQGGNSSSYSGTGSKGGYSEGEITLAETTTFYVFVGGKGASSGNGGWNGGGGSTGSSSYNSGNTYGRSYPACGGGATDIATMTSDMSYSSKRNNRSAASLLSRCIVAGGGAGGSARYTEVTTTTTTTSWENVYSFSGGVADQASGSLVYKSFSRSVSAGETYRVINVSPSPYKYSIEFWGGGKYLSGGGTSGTAPSGADTMNIVIFYTAWTSGVGCDLQKQKTDTTSSTDTSSGSSNASQQGGGTSGRGTSPGTQNSGGGEFGKGKNQDITNYRYASGAGGGGWYGGGSSYSDSSTGQINSSGGGSGFVNTPTNASYRPSGYTGLELDSGSTKDGATSFPSPSGGNETGHSGNGYCKITVL